MATKCPTKKYVVGVFPLEKSVEAVPTCWLDKDGQSTWWPTHVNNSTLVRLIMAPATPEYGLWKKVPIRVIGEAGMRLPLQLNLSNIILENLCTLYKKSKSSRLHLQVHAPECINAIKFHS